MKNFKKVISAVIALALSASTLVSAASFSDVAKTAPYAEAVDVLSSLGIINGYEDGTFRPEGQITRAEAATMIVGALNMTADAQNSGSSIFADVNEQAAWAAGYVNVGTTQKFISGFEDGTFRPQENVTYAQMCVMLTSIAGYGEYAANGGYPKGYTDMAASTGINKGVAATDNTPLTRGQVAQMIYNTLVVPMLGVSEYNLTGNTYAPLDGKGSPARDFKTLLSDKFGGYVATIMIVETPVADGLDSDEVVFDVQKADYWTFNNNKTAVPTQLVTSLTNEPGRFDAENVDVNAYNKQIGKAVFVANDDDEPVMVYFAPTTKTDKKEFDAADYVLQTDCKDGANRFDDNGKIRFGSKYYDVEASAVYYVNGKALTGTAVSEATLDEYLGNATGTITLIDSDDVKGADYIFVDIWHIAEVFGVEYENSETTITMNTVTNINSHSKYETIVITDEAVEDGETVVTVEKDGQAAELTSIAKGDIIAYKSDMTVAGTELEDPKTIHILATNDVVSGKVTGIDEDDETYTINGTAYEMVNWSNSFVDIAKSYTITLDPFGRMFDKTLDGSTDLYGIFISGRDDVVKLVLADGTTKSYTMESDAGAGTFAGKDADDIDAMSFTNIYNRIVTYKVRNSTGEIMSIQPATANLDASAWTSADEYMARTGRLGDARILATTNMIDASKAVAGAADMAANYTKFNPENLKDGSEYYYAVVTTGTLTNLVVVKQVGTKINSESRFAVVKKTPSLQETEDGDEVEVVGVLLDGKETTLTFNTGVYNDITNKNSNSDFTDEGEVSLQLGDAFFYEVDSYGYVDRVFRVFTRTEVSSGVFTNDFLFLEDAIETVYEDDHATPLEADDFIELSNTAEEFWSDDLSGADKADVKLVEGYVVEGSSDLLSFAAITSPLATINTNKNMKDDATGVAIYSVTEDSALYCYDSNADVSKDSDKYTVKSNASMLTSTGLAKYLDDGIYTAGNVNVNGSPATDMAGDANYAIALIVDGEVAIAYVIK